MSGSPLGFSQLELKFIAEPKPLLPIHVGEARYQQALDNDRTYREMLLAAFGLALFAATSFGESSNVIGPYRTALLCIAAAGLALRAIHPRFLSGTKRRNLVEGSMRRLWMINLLLFGALGSLLAIPGGLVSLGVVTGFTIWALLATGIASIRWFVYVLSSIAVVCTTVWTMAFRGSEIDPISAMIAFILGILVVANSLFAAWSQSSEMQPVILLTSFATYGWLCMTSVALFTAPWHLALCAVSFTVYAVLERLISIRSSFAPVIVMIIILHLSGFVCWQAGLGKTIVPQITVLLLEFGLLGMAGYRHTLASLSKYPRSTYRSSPQCLVPAQDHAWDHPIKIDAT